MGGCRRCRPVGPGPLGRRSAGQEREAQGRGSALGAIPAAARPELQQCTGWGPLQDSGAPRGLPAPPSPRAPQCSEGARRGDLAVETRGQNGGECLEPTLQIPGRRSQSSRFHREPPWGSTGRRRGAGERVNAPGSVGLRSLCFQRPTGQRGQGSGLVSPTAGDWRAGGVADSG